MSRIPVPVGASARLERTITRDDIDAFARLSGDFHPFHVDRDYARAQGAPDCLAHGLLTMSLLSAVGTRLYDRYGVPVVAYGYDRVRFVRPVFAGDTLTVTYEVEKISQAEMRAYSACTCVNQHGETVLVATQITKFL